MNKFPVNKTSLLALLAAISLIGPVEGRLYRWVDENGEVHYTDTIPPEHIRKGRTEFSPGGVPIDQVPRAKTAKEIQQEEELARLRAQQQRLIEQQHAADRVLLRTFRSENDLLIARDGKVASIDAMIQVTKNNIRRQEEWLAGLRTEAANKERAGKSIPQHLQDSIGATERSIRDASAAIAKRQEQKESIRASFEQDLKRFRQLHGRNTAEQRRGIRNLHPMIHDIVTCANDASCNLLWDRAVVYVRSHTMIEIQTGASNSIIMAEPPSRDGDIHLVLTRVRDAEGPGAALFLEIQCWISQRGQRNCRQSDARKIVEGFRAAVAGEEASARPR